MLEFLLAVRPFQIAMLQQDPTNPWNCFTLEIHSCNFLKNRLVPKPSSVCPVVPWITISLVKFFVTNGFPDERYLSCIPHSFSLYQKQSCLRPAHCSMFCGKKLVSTFVSTYIPSLVTTAICFLDK